MRNHKEKFLEYGADVIVFGEGEETMTELVQCFMSSSNPDLHNIQGIAFKDERDGCGNAGKDIDKGCKPASVS